MWGIIFVPQLNILSKLEMGDTVWERKNISNVFQVVMQMEALIYT